MKSYGKNAKNIPLCFQRCTFYPLIMRIMAYT